MKIHRSAIDRMMDRVEIILPSDCWIFTGSTNGKYGLVGSINSARGNEYAHRISYKHFIGEIPIGMMVCHSCDNTLCVNPKHLWVGTAKDNARDCISKGRRSKKKRVMPSGPDAPRAKLSWENIDEIRSMRLGGSTYHKIASKFGIAYQTVAKICTNQRYIKGDTQCD